MKAPVPFTHVEKGESARTKSGPPPFLRQLSPEMLALLEQHFWCDFHDVIPAMTWDDKKPSQ